MPTTYPLRDEPGKTMFVFEKHGRIYGHNIKNRPNKELAVVDCYDDSQTIALPEHSSSHE